MAFPATALGVIVELYLGPTLGWVDITDDVRLGVAHSGGGITIRDRGRTNEDGGTGVTVCSLVINNRSGNYSPRNPASPYYGLLGRNTPIRVRVADTDPGGALAVDGRRGAGSTAPGAAVTAAHSSLNGTGDLDVRVWLRMPQWQDHGGVFLAGKQDAWSLAVGDTGSLEFRWVNSSSVLTTTSSGTFKPAPAADGSLAVRVVLTVATGARVFYTAPTMAGPWTALSNNTFGATDIKASPTFGVEVGRVSSFGDHGVNGELYAMELRSSGTLVASPDFTTLRAGDTQLVDAQGRTWTWSGGAVPVDRGARFYGEVSAWPPRWDLSGNDRWVPIDAAGVTQRLAQGKSPVQSPLRRSLTAIDPAAYLPLEDGADATRPTSAAVGVASATSSKVTYGVTSGRLGGTVSVAQMTDAASVISTPVQPRPLSSTWSALLFFKLSSAPVGADQTYLRLFSQGGTATKWEFQLSGGGYRWIGYDKAGSVVDDRSFSSAGQPPTDWLMMYVEWQQVAGTVTWDTWVANAGETVFSHGSFSYSGTVGNPTRVDVIGNSYFVNALVSHLAVDNQRIFLSDDFAKVSTGYLGETAGGRLARLAAEEGVPLTFWGYPHDTATMGPQPVAPLLDVLRDAAAADGGILLEGRGHLGLAYRTRASLYNQPAIALDYASGHIAAPFEPTDDDDGTRNDVTVSRPDGGSARAVQTTGPLSVLAPPDGVGTYDTSTTVNVAADNDLPDQAGWRLHLGTVDEARYPRIRINLAGHALAADAALTRAVALADAGDVLSISSLPAWLPPGPAEVMAQGYTETLDAHEWSIVWNAAPASPWDVAVVDGGARVAADGSTLGSDLAASDMTLALSSTVENGPWTQEAADLPLDMRVGAERVTAGSIDASASDGFDRTVSNGWGAGWSTFTGAASEYSVGSGVGTITVASTAADRGATLDLGAADQDITVLLKAPGTPTNASLRQGIVARFTDANTHYRAGVAFFTSGTVAVELHTRVGGTLTQLAQIPIGVSNASDVWLRVQAIGSRVLVKAWQQATTPPRAWTVDVTDTTVPAAAKAGVWVRRETGNTGPTSVAFDGFVAPLPQRVTLSARGLNGMQRAWPAGTPVDVWQPAILSL